MTKHFTVKCDRCGAEGDLEGDRLPRNWTTCLPTDSEVGERHLCPACSDDLRGITERVLAAFWGGKQHVAWQDSCDLADKQSELHRCGECLHFPCEDGAVRHCPMVDSGVTADMLACVEHFFAFRKMRA